jgi:AcrR family transcriptional regulator
VAKAVVKKKAKSRQRSQRKKPDLDAILEVAIELVLRHGDSGFRIEELIERTGISKSSLYLHFGDRDGLVGLALSTAFLRDIRNNVDDAAVLLADVKNRKQMEEAIPQLVELALNTPDFARWQRVMVLASARNRPEMMKRVSEGQTMVNTAIEELVRGLQNSGAVRIDLDAREIGVLIQTAIIGRIFRDIDSEITAEDLDKWRAILVSVYEGILA